MQSDQAREVTAIPAATGTGLLVTDLLCGADTVARRLGQALAQGQHLDAYLLAAGMSQLVEDRLHPDPMLLFRAASHLRRQPSRPARAAGAVAGALGLAARIRLGPQHRRLAAARDALAALTTALAREVLGLTVEPGGGLEPALTGQLLAVALAAVPALRGDVIRLPACFHGFDQHPDDVAWLVAEFRRWQEAGAASPRRGQSGDMPMWAATPPAGGPRHAAPRSGPSPVPLCVVGVRTSGSYLAPLYVAALQASAGPPAAPDGQAAPGGLPAGAPRVEMLTYRPGRPFRRWERARLARVARAGGLAIVTDDPPGTGSSLAAAAAELGRAGFPDTAIVVAFSSFGEAGDEPSVLRRWPALVQPWAEWSVHKRLEPASIGRVLAQLAGPGLEVAETRSVETLADPGNRGHVRARYAVWLTDRRTGENTWRDILVEGAGLGYLGRQALAVASVLPGHVPHVHGFANGLLLRDWLPAYSEQAHDTDGAKPPDAGTLAATVAGYVRARQRCLPAASDAVDRLAGRDAAWEVAARLLAGQFGPLGLPARPLLLEPAVRRLLAHDGGAVLDGKTDTRHWLPDPAAGGALRKADFYQRAFGHLDLACYDPVFDLAGAAADPPEAGFEALLREAYQRAGGLRADGERWLLYRLAQIYRLRRAGDLSPALAAARSATAVHDYLAALYLRDVPPGNGALVAIDLDGTLECDRLGYPATSPTGALALRALIAHGYQPVLASGRSLSDIADRCTAFGLAGGVAEYGAAVWLSGTQGEPGTGLDMLPPASRALLDRVRGELAAMPGVTIDSRFQLTVRARSGDGPLPPEAESLIRAVGGHGVHIIRGEGQTDVVAAGTDKGSGLTALAARLFPATAQVSGGHAAVAALAVGDTPPDLAMFDRAAMARAPRNAKLGSPGASIPVTKGAYQAGLSQACAALLGHRPGHCPLCEPPEFPRRTKAMLAVLDLRSNGLRSIPGKTAALAAALARQSRW